MKPFWSPLWPIISTPWVALDERRQPGLHVAAAPAFAVLRADLRREHLVERRPLENGV